MNTLPLRLAVLAVCCCLIGTGRDAAAHAGDPPPPPPPLPGAQQIADELQAHHRFLFSEEELKQVDTFSGLLGQAFWGSRDEKDPAKLRALDEKRTEGEALLVAFLEQYPRAIDITVVEPGKVTQAQSPTFELQSDNLGVLFRIHNGEGPVIFTRATWDLEDTWELQPETAVPYGASGTTYALLNLASVPSGDSHVSVGFKPQDTDGPVAQASFTVVTPERGRARFTFRDENGEDTPVLMRLVSRYDRRERRPAGALDYSNQFDPGGVPPPGFTHEKRWMGIPGDAGGFYYTVPGSFEMALPPGDFDLTLYHGIEYAPIKQSVTVRSGELTEAPCGFERWTNMPARGWWSGDGHVHARILSDEDAVNILTFTRAVDVNVANVLRMGDHRRTWYEQRGFGPAFRVRHGNHVLVPGQEGPRYYMGHAVGLNLKRMVRDRYRYLDNAWVADTIHADGGLYGQAHLAGQLFGIDRDLAMLVPRGKSDFGEVLQFGKLDTDLWYEYLDLGFQLAPGAGSDVPYGGCIGDVRVYAHTGSNTLDPDAWFDAFKQGRVFVSNGPMVEFTVDGHGPGEEIVLEESRPLKVRAAAWGCPGASAPKSLKIMCLGEAIQELRSDDAQQARLETELTVDSGHGVWIAARVEGHDGTAAHTAPVYVRRKGFRHWSTDRAPQLLEARLKTLDQLRGDLENHQRAVENGTLDPSNHFGQDLGKQAHYMFGPIAEVRTIFEGLQAKLEEERGKRGE